MKHITCKQAVDYISKKEEGKLSAAQRVNLWRHLAVCSLCRIFNQQNKIIAKAFSGFGHKEEHRMSMDQKQAMLDTILNNKSQ
jgi:hypothetical protein